MALPPPSSPNAPNGACPLTAHPWRLCIAYLQMRAKQSKIKPTLTSPTPFFSQLLTNRLLFFFLKHEVVLTLTHATFLGFLLLFLFLSLTPFLLLFFFFFLWASQTLFSRLSCGLHGNAELFNSIAAAEPLRVSAEVASLAAAADPQGIHNQKKQKKQNIHADIKVTQRVGWSSLLAAWSCDTQRSQHLAPGEVIFYFPLFAGSGRPWLTLSLSLFCLHRRPASA